MAFVLPFNSALSVGIRPSSTSTAQAVVPNGSFVNRNTPRLLPNPNPIPSSAGAKRAPIVAVAPAVPRKPSIDSSNDKFHGYDRFADDQKMYKVNVSGVVHGDLHKAFDLLSDWSETSEFWAKTFDSSKPTHKAGHPNMVDDTRNFVQNGRSYSEVLLSVDEKASRLQYGLTASSEPSISAAVTTMDLDPIPGNSSAFKFSITSVFQPSYPYPAVVNAIKQAQKAAYQRIITTMKKTFNPEVALLTLSILSGYMNESSPDYMALNLSDGKTVLVETMSNGSPVVSDDIDFEVMSMDDDLSISIYDRRFIFGEKMLASATIPMKNLKNGNVDVPMKDDDGKIVGQYTLYVNIKVLDEVSEDPDDIGAVALLVLEDLSQKITEIAIHNVGKDPYAAETWEYMEYSDEFGHLPKYCSGVPARSAIMPARVGDIMQRTTELLYSQLPLLGMRPALAKMTEQMKSNPEAVDQERLQKLSKMMGDLLQDPYLLPFRRWVPKPAKVIQNLKDIETSDLEIAAQLLRGVNPMKVTVVNAISDIAEELRSLKDDRGRSVDEMIASKDLFYCDYHELMIGSYNPKRGVYRHTADLPTGGKAPTTFWYAPKLAVYKNGEGKLDILGFTLTRFTDQPNIVYSKHTPKNTYTYAKLHLACADNQHHQWISHLGYGHLAMEPFAVANNNAFPLGEDRHPIGKLLEPHFQDTIGINFLARQTLVSSVAPFTDATFSTGTGNALKIFSSSYREWDFFGGNFPNHLKSRGFTENCGDGLSGYHYRDDGFMIWNAYKDHFTAIVNRLYGNDAAVARDEALQGWCKELRDPARGAVATFPDALNSKALLVDVLTTLVFYCSAQHAAVNFPQLRYVSYVPNRPDSMLAPMPDERPGGKDIPEDLIFNALPSPQNTQFQALFAYLLSTPPDNPLDTYNATMEDFPNETANFMQKLKEIHNFIETRNAKLEKAGDIPYEYLDPTRIPQSVNI